MRDIFKVITAGYLAVFLIGAAFFPFQNVRAEISHGASMSSDNFKVLDAQHGSFGGISSSSSGNFILLGNIGDIAIGSSSITNFKLNSGFLYYPHVIAPTLNSATAGTNQVALAWTAATGLQGFSISGYNVCTKTTGAYTCEDVGNVVVFTKSSLTAGTSYTFKIEAKDSLGDIIAVSNELSATPTGTAPTPTPTPTPAPGGGGGGGYIPPPTGGPTGTITINGISYPQSTVTIYNDGAIVASITAGANAKFQATLSNIAVGSHTISLNSADPNGRKSVTISFIVNVTANTTVILSDVLLPPTIDISATQLARGDTLRIFGQAQPVSVVDVHVFSTDIVNNIIADSAGAYALIFDTKPLAEDTHTTKSRATASNIVSPFSQVLQFILGKGARAKTADLNKEGKVGITDFSILLYWWNTSNTRGLGIADINSDGKVNIIDFSIMLFQWTG
jgi:hypothetical protein